MICKHCYNEGIIHHGLRDDWRFCTCAIGQAMREQMEDRMLEIGEGRE